MILTKVDYYEKKGETNYWQINDVNLGQLNLVIGSNATGKTRLINIVTALSKMLSKKIAKFPHGNWYLEFKDEEGSNIYKYNLEILKGEIVLEEIFENEKKVLRRAYEEGKILSYTQNKDLDFSPPKEELTAHVRRDVREFPFLEKLLKWANNLHGYMFSGVNPSQIIVPSDKDALLENLGTTPYLLVEALKSKEIKEAIIDAFSSIGYPIEEISVSQKKLEGAPSEFLFSTVKESDLNCFTEQILMSQGMYRALSLIVIIEYLLRFKEDCTVVIDDLGEGLDFQRSSKITKWLFDRIKNSSLQLIATSNDRFLINAVDLEYLNLLERNGHIVESYNYLNSREKFEEFKLTGLSNFDFFSGGMYKDRSNN